MKKIFKTDLGYIFWADAKKLMRHIRPNKVNLIVSSPPYALLLKKEYGNKDDKDYVNWFRRFVPGFKKVLTEDGSLVLNFGNAYLPKIPSRSLYQYKLLLMLCEEYGLHLCQEFYWIKPNALATPAEWCNVRKIRFKDAVENIWWLSKSPWPKVSNQRLLTEYSQAMENLLGAKPGKQIRPSGYAFGESVYTRNAGAIPSNCIYITNASSNDQYRRYCRARDIPMHPAVFPPALPWFFIRALTDKNDVVFDPFAGSCTTGMVAEHLARRWVCCDISKKYCEAGIPRLSVDLKYTPSTFTVKSPDFGRLPEEATPLNAGRTR